MNKSVSLFGVLIVSALIGGCATGSSGNEALRHESEVGIQTKLVEGKSTKQEVRKMYGSPIRTTFTDAGLEIWTYEFKNVSADAVAYIPIVNMFGATASGTRKELVVLFNRDGVVQRYSMSESDVKDKTGLFNR
jgi:outer membrane protein assembly factor BamE (lipoprotein component of BamABCDE complex)